MKKRKIYEISVIDKTYSKTISDETKFYTSDTALELGFELKETEYDFESAEIVLLNIDDRSLVTRPVAKVLDSFAYELDDDIIAHYGDWRGQLRFEQDGEIYVSSPVKFRIENDLGNERPPQLSDVQSWVSLKRYADSLTEELKQAVLSVEGIGDTFNTNELERQDQFSNAEQLRQTTFETSESERDETFNTNETTRQTQELEREKAEGTRQSVFDDNEASRNETFNNNEATRQENETTRQQAETQRATAESSRASAEEQRKIDHENRSAELDGKADKVVIKNLLENGDFSDGVTGWVANIGELKAGSGTVLFTPTGNYSRIIQHNDMVVSHVYYHAMRAKATGSTPMIYPTSPVGPSQRIKGTGEWDVVSIIHKPTVSSTEIRYVYNGTIGVPIEVDWILMIDLTAIFGVGNEPTKEEMDELIKVTGYIDGEYALNNKEMLIWTLALIRRNKNAIVALGGTI